MREAFGCGVYPGPDQQRRSNKTDYGNAVWQRFCHPSLWRVASRKKRQQQRQIRTTANASKLRQGDHAPGVDGKLLAELLGRNRRTMSNSLLRGEHCRQLSDGCTACVADTPDRYGSARGLHDLSSPDALEATTKPNELHSIT